MKVRNWWVQPNLLTSGNDPTTDLANAAQAFADDYTPMIFMTGDGHRSPPFAWTSRGPWPHFFAALVNDDKICCHVELYSDAVNATSVPHNLTQVFANNKVFGWEPEVYKTIQPILEDLMRLRPKAHLGDSLDKADLRQLTSAMFRVHNMGYLMPEGLFAMKFWDKARASPKDPVPPSALPGLPEFLDHYDRTAMQLRTGINNVIGRNIQSKINQFPDHIHLITCGDAHIIHNPLYNFIDPPAGIFGIADQNSH